MNAQPLIVIDPGHGGTQPADGSRPNNAVGPNGLLEKDLTLAVAQAASRILQSAGRQVVLTREDDRNLSLADRAKVARDRNAGVFISIHLNGSSDPLIDGTEVYVASNASDSTRRLALQLLQSVSLAVRVAPRGLRTAGFSVLSPGAHLPQTAACLVELAYLSNPAQARRLAVDAYLHQLGLAVAQGILGFSATKSLGVDLGAACGNPGTIGAGEKYAAYDLMGVQSDRSNPKENVFLRWGEIPQNTCELDIVVHFHGWNITQETKFFEYVVRNSGLDIHKPDNTPARTRPTLYVLPFGQFIKQHPDSRREYGFPIFTRRTDALSKLIDFSLDEIAARHQLPAGTFRMGRLILTAHSGGGDAVNAILRRETDRIDEVHLFDSTYGAQAGVIAWAKKKMENDSHASPGAVPAGGGALRVLYLPFSQNCSTSGTAAGSLAIQRELRTITDRFPHLRSRYRVETTRIRHTAIPRIFGFQLLIDAGTNLEDSFAAQYIHPCAAKRQSQSLGYPGQLVLPDAK